MNSFEQSESANRRSPASGLLDAIIKKWTERRTNLLQCSKLAAGRGAYTEANTMQIRADATLQCLEELAELRQASNKKIYEREAKQNASGKGIARHDYA